MLLDRQTDLHSIILQPCTEGTAYRGLGKFANQKLNILGELAIRYIIVTIPTSDEVSKKFPQKQNFGHITDNSYVYSSGRFRVGVATHKASQNICGLVWFG